MYDQCYNLYKFRSFKMKRFILFLLITLTVISLYSHRVTEGMIRLSNYDVVHADFIGQRNENLYILTRAGDRELLILERDDILGIYRRGRGERLRREVTEMVFNEPDWFNFNITEHIDGFRWFNQNLNHNDAHIEILALITISRFHEFELRGITTFSSIHRLLRNLDLTNAHNAEVINIRTSLAQGIALQDLLSQDQPIVRTDIPTIPLLSPDSPPRETGIQNENLESAVRNAASSLVGNIPLGLTVAVVHVSSNSNELSEFILQNLYNSISETGNYTLSDSHTISIIRSDRGYELTSELDDRQATEVGRTLGAEVVITGALVQTGRSETLTLRALKVETAETIGMARERVN